MKFELELRNGRVRQYELLALFLVLLNVLFFAAVAFTAEKLKVKYIAIAAILIIASAFVVETYLKRRNRLFNAKTLAVVVIVLFYLYLQYWWLATAVAALNFLYVVTLRRLVVSVNPVRVSYPSFPKRDIAWSDLNNLILKDGLLTIDFKNNRLAQVEIMYGDKQEEVNEAEFNEFCRQQLRLASR